MPRTWVNQLISIKHKLELFHANDLSYPYIPRNSESSIIQCFYSSTSHHHGCLTVLAFAGEYSIRNATVAAQQLWMADLKPHILSNTINQVYAAFFYSDFTQGIQNLPEEILFGHFVTTLNDTFETELAQEDKGYESGSENFNIPTPLSRALRIYHV